MAKTDKRCKDCVADHESAGTAPKRWRPAPHVGPRCATHHRLRKRHQREQTHQATVARLYGVDRDMYDRLREFQQGRCAICPRRVGRSRHAPVDHDHVTGEVRGLLCSPCNRYVGYIRDNPATFQRGADYLRDPPLRRLNRQEDS